MKNMHGDLSVLDGLLPAARQYNDVADINHKSDSFAVEVLDYRLQQLGCDAWCRDEAKRYARTFVFYAVDKKLLI